MTKYLLIICYIKKGVLNMKKIILSIISIFIIITILIVDNSKVINKEDNNKIKVNNNLLSMMLETEAESGKYEMTSSSSWPTDGYVFNSNLSKCENGSILSWDETNKKVVMEGNVSDKCYIYFDAIVPPNVSDFCSNGQTLSSCITSFGNQGTKISNIYIHNSSLENGAEDNSYRFAGTIEDVKNYICLGSSEATCPADNLYRIIGVFGENNHDVAGQQLVKVIKNTSIGNIAWNTTTSTDWSSASLKTTLNSTFITENLSGVEDKIAEVSWKVSGFNDAVNAQTIYIEEITNATNKYTSKIGLMYISDYGFATYQNYWTTNLYDYNLAAKNKDWLYLGTTEWTLSLNFYSDYIVWNVDSSGCAAYANSEGVTDTFAVRPSFYLTVDVVYVSGLRTSSDPIRVK